MLYILNSIILGKRTVEHTLSEADNKIKNYEEKFAQLKSDFQNHAILYTEITVLQVKLSTLSALGKLDDIGKFNVILTLMSIIITLYSSYELGN